MYLGINWGHDAGVAVTNSKGIVEYAVAEERISRIKNHVGIPVQSLKLLSKHVDLGAIENVVIGNGWESSTFYLERFLADFMDEKHRKVGLAQPITPGLRIPRDPKVIQKELLQKLEAFLGANPKRNYLFPRHHDSHLGCAIGVANLNKSSLLLSLDGEGDGESGAVSSLQFNQNQPSSILYKEHARFPALDSLGLLYAAVTRAYNFKPLSHEGKITGLAAFGQSSQAVDILMRYVRVKNGIPEIRQTRNFKQRFLRKSLKHLGLGKHAKKTLHEIIQIAESQTVNYPDLAYAVQKVLENSVIEIISFWQKKLQCHSLALAGGVFANVKLNQKISETELFRDVRIFPNMGDGGIALGGIWYELFRRDELSHGPLFENMFMAPDISIDEDSYLDAIKSKGIVSVEIIGSEELPNKVARLLFDGEVGAIHKGKMEFGPRALCNRSILADPRDSSVNISINERLKRTEFMPFAPVVKFEKFHEYFTTSEGQSIFPFKFMTMTCKVKSKFLDDFPGVVHIDETARPQIIERSDDELMWKILDSFEKLSGIALLINTSFNVHEEPINFHLEDSLEALQRNAVDFLVYKNHIIRTKY